MTALADYSRHPDLFPMQIAPFRQRAFIQLWHRHPDMSVVELARRSELSRPTCYRIIRLLEERGDIRGRICNKKHLADEVKVPASASTSSGDLSYARRADLLRQLRIHEEYVRLSLSLLGRYDEAFSGYLTGEEIDLPDVLKRLERTLERRLPASR